jgi:hypothetical protein
VFDFADGAANIYFSPPHPDLPLETAGHDALLSPLFLG